MHHASRLGNEIRSMSRDEFCTANRRNWDERVAIHRRDATGFYQVERFLAGETRLYAIDSGELGETAGKRLIHLQCHFGLDTLILAREGAVATGLDFSPAAIAAARRLAAKIGVAADFVCADVYDAPQVVEGEFDIVFTTWGTICWLPDIVRWAETIASLLAPGGVFYFPMPIRQYWSSKNVRAGCSLSGRPTRRSMSHSSSTRRKLTPATPRRSLRRAPISGSIRCREFSAR
jgi:2-polyprenyl-3-methyl-5-hydroxy-6-metoxy-1,4-benzoquinol methylase